MKTKISILIAALIAAACASSDFNRGGANPASSTAGAAPGGFGVLGAVLQSRDKIREATTDMTEAQEIELGQGIAANLLGVAPLLPNKSVQHYVNQVGRWLAMQTERPDLPWQFAVLDDPGLNAFAAPGGYIFITKGLLARMRSEAELAGVLAHEITHVLKKHHVFAIKKSAGAGLMADIGSQVVAARTGINSTLAGNLAGVFKEVYSRGLDKADEFEADRMGVVIAARAGYDPYGLPAVLQMMESISPGDSGIALMFKTHPPLAARLDLLDRWMSTSFDRFEKQPALAARFMTSLGNNRRK